MGEEVELKEERADYSIKIEKGYNGDLVGYAKSAVWYGRKGGSFRHKVERIQG